jgi:hypothetical protein
MKKYRMSSGNMLLLISGRISRWLRTNSFAIGRLSVGLFLHCPISTEMPSRRKGDYKVWITVQSNNLYLPYFAMQLEVELAQAAERLKSRIPGRFPKGFGKPVGGRHRDSGKLDGIGRQSCVLSGQLLSISPVAIYHTSPSTSLFTISS